MKKQLVLFLALALCLGLTACGDTESDDTQSGYETVMDMEFLDGMWSIDGTAKLYFDSTEGFYAYRTRWGLGGRGEFELSEASGRPMIFFNGLLYNFLLRDDGVLLPNRNGEGSGLTIHRNTFLRDDEAEIVEWDISNWDGMWQNALGETIVINSSLMQYIACSPDYSMSGTMDDEGEGMGLYLYDNGTRAYLCPGDDGNSFTLSAERFGRYGDDQHFDGVFYRDADFYAYSWYICYVTLENFDLSHLPVYFMGEEQLARYSLYMSTLGNRPDLFPGSAYVDRYVTNPPAGYEVPGEYLDDETFAAMLSEAEKYLGYPYVWGGSSPATSFDCSGFVSWVINHSGWNVGRLGAQGLYNICTRTSSPRPGDLVFFKGTYDTPGVSHVGIYVGDGMMIHCGDPISYANLNTSYWQSHFYAYGRLP